MVPPLHTHSSLFFFHASLSLSSSPNFQLHHLVSSFISITIFYLYHFHLHHSLSFPLHLSLFKIRWRWRVAGKPNQRSMNNYRNYYYEGLSRELCSYEMVIEME
ncbi:unnamed protein product [Cuscuta epithymum]|uniref:Transmembrane protein n=1 Tax=Cuscuta epithymum TaxID=186058 RepID=A0AAV0F589_9ASTE|nr:unnamed protein product [Cuscuta epithymum]